MISPRLFCQLFTVIPCYPFLVVWTVVAQVDDPQQYLPEKMRGVIVKPDIPVGLTTPQRLQLDRPFQHGLRCGPNALYVYLRLRGLAVPYDDVIAALPLKAGGVSLADIARASQEFGHSLQLRKGVSPSDLTNANLPAIVHIRTMPQVDTEDPPTDHFTVLVQESNGIYSAFDTTNMMNQELPRETLARNMTGYVAFAASPRLFWQHMNRTLFAFLIFIVAAILLYDGLLFYRSRSG